MKPLCDKSSRGGRNVRAFFPRRVSHALGQLFSFLCAQKSLRAVPGMVKQSSSM